jgi:hypothetical protein
LIYLLASVKAFGAEFEQKCATVLSHRQNRN